MLALTKRGIQPLIESSQGLHVSAYIPVWSTIFELRGRLSSIITDVETQVRPVLSDEERREFLKPLNTLLKDVKLLESFSGSSLGIFRNRESFRIVRIPIKVDFACSVATTFHIKPLLNWIQRDGDFLIVGLGRKAASIYRGDQSGFSYIDHAVYPTLPGIKLTVEGAMKWLSFVIGDLTRTSHPVLFLAGQQTMVRAFIDTLDYPNLYPETLSSTFRSQMAPELCQMARAALHEESKTRVESRMAELNEAKGRGLASTDLREIASLAVKGSVKTLFIAEGVQIFGRLDTESGELVVHSGDLNHEDDDLLDDVAQLVLMKGGDVLMAPGSLLPPGTPLAAVLKREPRR